MKKVLLVVLVFMLLPALALFAGGGGKEKADEKVMEKTEEAVKEAPKEMKEAEKAPAGPGELRVTFAWPTYIDPAVGSDFSSSSAFVNIYDTLVYPTPDGGVKPHVAESWETSSDGLVWTFHLRKDVKFHDGSGLTAEDVVFTMDRITTIGEGYGYMYLGKVQSSEAVDDYTVRFTLSEPYGPFLVTLVRLYILNKDLVMANRKADGTYGDMGDYAKEWLLTNDAGSGPYRAKDVRLEEYVLMEKFDGYWGYFAPSAPDIVKFIGTTEAVTVRTMMSRKELEIGDQWQSVEALNSLDALEGVEIANGFHELSDSQEQRLRFERENGLRAQRDLPFIPMDLHLLSALEVGLPDCSGVALGVDRLLMILTGSREIASVLAFPFETA